MPLVGIVPENRLTFQADAFPDALSEGAIATNDTIYPTKSPFPLFIPLSHPPTAAPPPAPAGPSLVAIWDVPYTVTELCIQGACDPVKFGRVDPYYFQSVYEGGVVTAKFTIPADMVAATEPIVDISWSDLQRAMGLAGNAMIKSGMWSYSNNTALVEDAQHGAVKIGWWKAADLIDRIIIGLRREATPRPIHST